MGSVGVVEELVAQVELVVVAEAVEGADRVGVVGPAFIAWNTTWRSRSGAWGWWDRREYRTRSDP